MILDKENMFSEDQAITATASSTNVIKVPKNLGKGQPVRLFVQVTEDFATLTSLKVAIRTDDAVSAGDLASASVLLESEAVPVASLVKGYKFNLEFVPGEADEYIDLNYTVAGSNATAGKISAGIVFDNQSAS